MSNIERLKEIMVLLRDPKKGCPWDVEQDFKSISPHTIEEAYEVVDAIEIVWPAGSIDRFTNVAGNQEIEIVEGEQAFKTVGPSN